MKPNKERLQQLHDMLDNVPDAEFDSFKWTTCTIGHGIKRGLIPELSFDRHNLMVLVSKDRAANYEDVAKIFGLRNDMHAIDVFDTYGTRQQAQARLRELISNG